NFWNDTTYGNLWADRTSPDAESDGIVDEPYLIDGGDAKDYLPLAISLAVLSPVNGLVTGNASVEISGNAVSYFGVSQVTWYNDATGGSGTCVGTETWSATVALAEGSNHITVTMTDLSGNQAHATITLVQDITPPTLEITSPEEGAFTGGSVTVVWTGSDDISGISHYNISIDGGAWMTATSPYAFNGLAQGDHVIIVKAFDLVGNNASASVNMTVDATPPNVEVLSPMGGYVNTTGSITITWTGNDTDSGIDHYEVSWEGMNPVSVSNATFTYTFTGLSDGSHLLTVVAVDKVGLTSQDQVAVVVDTGPPSLTITYPAEGGYAANSDVTVTWSGSDAGTGIAYYIASIEGLEPFNTTGSSCTFNDLADGTYTVLVSAYDRLGNYRDVTVTFTVDTVAPTLTIVTPEEGQLFNTTSVTISWNTTDANPGTAQVRFDDEAWAAATGEDFVKTALTDGHHTAYVKVTDAAGNFVEGMVNFTVDTTAPAVAFISPEEGSLVNSSTGIAEWTVDDAVSSIRVDGGAWIEIGPNTSWEYSLEDGEHIIEVMVTDLAGNSASAALNFTVDTTAPTANVSPTGNQEPLSPLVVVEFSEAMNQTSVEIVVDGAEGSVDWNGNNATLTLSGRLAYGTAYNVTVTGKDLAGNVMTVNWTFSTMSVGSIQGVLVDGDGDPLAGISVHLSGGDIATTDSQGNFAFDQVIAGNYTLTVDADGYEPMSLNVTVENDGPTDLGEIALVSTGEEDGGGSSIWLYAIIAIVVLAVVGVAAFVFLRKK
ncbi:MAG: hypothetical protein GXY70_01275, partial [Euryarchaeota archaeon]|nr:hypothetical protein [Euryarchaeota archaeon]